MPQDNDQKPARSLGLSPAQIAGSALSAVSAAFVASWAGTTGTLIGAGVGSIVATIGAALYTASLRRSSVAVRRAAAQVRQVSLITGTLPRTHVEGSLRVGDGREGPEEPPTSRLDAAGVAPEGGVAQDHSDTSSDHGVGDGSWRDRLPWGKAVLASLAVMVVSLAGITAVEAITGHPISSWLGRNDSTGTSVGHLGGSGSSNTPTKHTGTNHSGGTGTGNDTGRSTPSQNANPSTPANPQPSAHPSQPQTPLPSVSANPAPSTAP